MDSILVHNGYAENIAKANQFKPSRDVVRSVQSNAELIAKSSNIAKVDELVTKFGGKARDWSKMKGWHGDQEYHWYKLKNGSTVGWKKSGEHDTF